jgi:hypothetical protein
MQRNNEEAVCQHVIDYMARRTGLTMRVTCRPDHEHREVEAVEVLFESSESRYALEHTRIEAFGGQIAADEKFLAFFVPLGKQFAKLPDHYDLVIDLEEARRIPRSDRERVQQIVASAVERVASTLRPGDAVNLGLPEPLASLELRRRAFGRPGLWLSRSISREFDAAIEAHRAKRICLALERKCPKLARCREDGRETVLALESNDLPLSNSGAIAAAVVAELRRRSDVPDYLYLFETEIEPWALWMIKELGAVWPEAPLGEMGPCYVSG